MLEVHARIASIWEAKAVACRVRGWVGLYSETV